MPYLATTRAGIKALISSASQETHLWLGSQVLSAEEIGVLRQRDLNVTVFNHDVISEQEVSAAVETVRQHHDGEVVWVEHPPEILNPRSSDVGQAFLWREFVVGASLGHNECVSVVSGVHAGKNGSLVSLLSVVPQALYVVELDSGQDAEIEEKSLCVAVT